MKATRILFTSLFAAASLLPSCTWSTDITPVESPDSDMPDSSEEMVPTDGTDSVTDDPLAPPLASAIESGTFVHPGTLNTQSELDVVRKKN